MVKKELINQSTKLRKSNKNNLALLKLYPEEYDDTIVTKLFNYFKGQHKGLSSIEMAQELHKTKS